MRPTMKRSRVAAAASAVLLLLVTACGESGDDGPAAPGSVDLRVAVWTADERHLELFDSIADAYKATHPEIGSITIESLPSADYNTTLTTQIAGGNAPDIAWVGDIATEMIDAGALAPLTDSFRATDGYNYDDILPSVATTYSKDGQLYAFPFSNSPFAMYVNLSLLEQAGQTVDLTNLTWEDVDEIGAAVHETTDKAGFVMRDFNFSSWLLLQTLWNGWGARAWAEDGVTCTMNSPQMVDAFEFLHTAIFEHGSHPGPGTTADFFAGDSAFTVAQVSRASLLDGSFEYDIQPLPAGPIGEYATLGQAGIAAFQGGRNVEEAVEFLAFFTNPENSAKLSQFFPPPRQSLLTGEKLAEVNTKFSAEQLDRVVVSQLPAAVSPPVHSGIAEIVATGKTSLDAMWQPSADIEAVLDSVCDALNPLLAE